MDEEIKWLFQRTSDGSTYLQITIVLLFFIFVIKMISKTAHEIAIIMESEGDKDDKTDM